jgi:hypothetical protein
MALDIDGVNQKKFTTESTEKEKSFYLNGFSLCVLCGENLFRLPT